jgi:putative hydrolase of the HAD superfamily
MKKMTDSTPLSSIDTILFDLDNTLFDHYYSLKNGISAIKNAYPQYLGNFDVNFLVETYNQSLEEAYQQYLDRQISYEEKDKRKIDIFFQKLGLPIPSSNIAKSIRSIYEESYQSDRRATPGSVETLVRLQENGYTLGILSNGQQKDQEIKAESIGVRILVEAVFTSEGLKAVKPDPVIFQKAAESLEKSPGEIIMIGDSIRSDITGAIESGMKPILYKPFAKEKSIIFQDVEVAVISKMKDILSPLGIQEPDLVPQTETTEEGEFVIKNLGVDIVTASRHCMNIDQQSVVNLFDNMQKSFFGV